MAQLAVYSEYISKNNIKPKILAWIFFAEDVGDILEENKSPTLNRYLIDKSFTQNLAKRTAFKDKLFKEFYQQYKKHPEEMKVESSSTSILLSKISYKLNQIIVLVNLRKYLSNIFNTEPPYYKKKETIDLIKKSIYRFKEEAEKTDSKIVFVYIPTWYEYDSSSSDATNLKHDNYLLRRDIFELLAKNNIEIIDTRKLIGLNGSEEARDYYNFSLYGHFTPNGYRKVGNYISEELRKIKKRN